MKIQIELTPKILEALTPAEQKQILLDLITVKPPVDIYEGNAPVTNAPIDLKKLNESIIKAIESVPGPLTTQQPIIEEQPYVRTKLNSKICSDQTFNRIISEYQAGKSISELCIENNLPYKTLWLKLKIAGVLKKKVCIVKPKSKTVKPVIKPKPLQEDKPVKACVQAHREANKERQSLAVQLLNDDSNGLCYVRGVHKKTLFPPITPEDGLTDELQAGVNLAYDKHRMSLNAIAEKFGITTKLVKRIILN